MSREPRGNRSRVYKAGASAAVVLVAGLVLAVSGLFEDNANSRPWWGYAWNKIDKRFEFWFNQYETRRDCIEGMRHSVQKSDSYSEPIGCGFNGNNYWLVWLIYTFSGDTHFECIFKRVGADAAKEGLKYGPLLIETPRTGERYYCL
jgi:hypothetical protein